MHCRALLQVAQYISEFHCLQLSSPTYLDQLSKIRAKFKQVSLHTWCFMLVLLGWCIHSGRIAAESKPTSTNF